MLPKLSDGEAAFYALCLVAAPRRYFSLALSFLLTAASCTAPRAEVAKPSPDAQPPVPPLKSVGTTPAAASASLSPAVPTAAPSPGAPVSAASSCLDERAVIAARRCPPGPPGDFTSLLQAELNVLKAPIKPRKPGDRAPRAFTPGATAWTEQAQRFLCAHPKEEERSEAMHSLARKYFEAFRWDEAATLFHEIAQTRTLAAPFAAQLALESVNQSQLLSSRPGCTDFLLEQAAVYQALHCAVPKDESREFCVTLDRVRAELLQRKGR